jgi:hypothetical protein
MHPKVQVPHPCVQSVYYQTDLPVAVFPAYNSDARQGRGAVRRVIWFLSPTAGDGQARVAATYKKTRSRIDSIDRIDTHFACDSHDY